MRISQPSELRTAGWACATARAVEAPQRPPTSAGDHRPGFVGLAAPRRPPPRRKWEECLRGGGSVRLGMFL